MYPGAGEVLHFSEDPTIARFEPHRAATAQQPEPYVWAVDAARAPDYWFPRQCPRVLAWVAPETTDRDRCDVLGASGRRLHLIEHGWLPAMRGTRLYAYRLPAEAFEPFGEPIPHAHVARVAVEPLGPPEPIGDLTELHAAAGIDLRAVDDLRGERDRIAASTLGFSAIRMRNASR